MKTAQLNDSLEHKNIPTKKWYKKGFEMLCNVIISYYSSFNVHAHTPIDFLRVELRKDVRFSEELIFLISLFSLNLGASILWQQNFVSNFNANGDDDSFLKKNKGHFIGCVEPSIMIFKLIKLVKKCLSAQTYQYVYIRCSSFLGQLRRLHLEGPWPGLFQG